MDSLGFLCDIAQIPSGFRTRAGSLEVLIEGGVEVLPSADGAVRKCFNQLSAHRLIIMGK